MMKLAFGGSCALVAVLACAGTGFAADQAGSAAGETVTAQPQPESYGTASDAVSTVGATALLPANSAVGFQNSGSGVFETTAAGDWWGSVPIPSGALVLRLEMDACDTDAAGAILFGLARFTSGGAGANVTAVGSTGATPGCAIFTVPVTTPFTMTNGNSYLTIFLNYGALTAANRAYNFRVYYRLQIRPAPATATFPTDVPTTHPFFRFVEAMASAGITGGCGAGVYCPDSPVTRGQMAVFFSTALGLHFAP